jgi:hypothetical protein
MMYRDAISCVVKVKERKKCERERKKLRQILRKRGSVMS